MHTEMEPDLADNSTGKQDASCKRIILFYIQVKFKTVEKMY